MKDIAKEYCLYLYENKINGKVYVGQTINLSRRDRQHTTCKNRSMPIDSAISKYGRQNFDLIIILITDSLDEINQEEIYWIARMREFIGKTKVYNICGGVREPMLLDTKLKISNSMKSHIRTNIHKENISISKMGKNNPMFNTKHSELHKYKISQSLLKNKSHTGRKLTTNQANEIRRLLSLPISLSRKILAKKFKVSIGTISNVYLNKSYQDINYIVPVGRENSIINFLKSGKYLSKEIAKMFNISAATVSTIKSKVFGRKKNK